MKSAPLAANPAVKAWELGQPYMFVEVVGLDGALVSDYL
jgi:hypothetical protein